MKLLNWTLGHTALVAAFTVILCLTCLLTVLGFWLGCIVFGMFLPAFALYNPRDPRVIAHYFHLILTFIVAVAIAGIIATCFNPIWDGAAFSERYFKTVAVGETLTLATFGVMFLVSFFTRRRRTK